MIATLFVRVFKFEHPNEAPLCTPLEMKEASFEAPLGKKR